MDAFRTTAKGDGEEKPHHFTGIQDQRIEIECDQQAAQTKSIIDYSPLQAAMDKNKESLKVKLLVRRTMNQLVEQGIMPSLKTSPAIYEQQRQLERAKTGDLLKAKIKQRPNRLELERRHILEHQEGNIDPSLAEKKRMLEKALLVDHLNSKISHRPGPLELIEKNILHAEKPIEWIVKEGLVNYTSTDEAVSPAQSLLGPTDLVCIEDDSLSSEGETQIIQKKTPINIMFSTHQKNFITALDNHDTSNIKIEEQRAIEKVNLIHCNTFVKPESYSRIDNTLETSKKSSTGSNKTDTKEKSKKKNKHKIISKARSIKFHEYKGPSNAQKHSTVQEHSGETNYQLIMKQQYLLEYLEEICKDPPSLPASSKMSFSTAGKGKDTDPSVLLYDSKSTKHTQSDLPSEVLNKLKVFQLKRYCKKYNLPVSGSKSSLVDRLKPYLYLMEKNLNFDGKIDFEVSDGCTNMDQKSNDGIEENLLKEQQKRIVELQNQLKKSQDELEQMKCTQMRSHQDLVEQHSQCSNTHNNSKTEPILCEELNIISTPLDKISSDMDIKITLRIDADTTSNKMESKTEPCYVENETVLNVVNSQRSMLDSDDSCGTSWRNNNLQSVVNDSILQCDSSPRKNKSFVSNNQMLDKLLGQVQPGIPSLNTKPEHTYKSFDSSSCSPCSILQKDSNTILGDSLHTALGIIGFNDVNLLDFHMHIDDTCDNGLTLPKTEENSLASMSTKNSFIDSNITVKMDEKNFFSDFDGLRFVHNNPYSNISITHNNSMNTVVTGTPNISKTLSKKENLSEPTENCITYTTNRASCSISTSRMLSEQFSQPGTSNTKREWLMDNIYYDNKFKAIHPGYIHPKGETCINRLEKFNVMDDKCSDIKFSYDSDSSIATGLSYSLNNNTGRVSPMDFDSLISNFDSPNINQSCDRALLGENQDRILYNQQHSNILDYFNDDYGMQNDSLTCEINTTSY
ncbi:uncharacterized protein LOC131432203 isoform X1 [Malaya genurostris]|uniref:uncharacterized protein LOC131432203 isoform X1 n=1 Tax=Malaya genurostris TaxID=325434 RepID=UPI0026F38748|nr:uncharacterized protein LOC131432203 isoform X1 [Malaya genurostris]